MVNPSSKEIVKRTDIGYLDCYVQVKDDQQSKEGNPFYFIQAADCQFGMIDAYCKKLPNPGWLEEIELSKKLVSAVHQMEPKPAFMIICGDLCHAYPGDPLRREQVRDFKRIFGKLDPEVKLLCVCGNHDIGNKPTRTGLAEYRKDFGDDYYYFIMNEVLFIVLNSQFYEHRENMEDYAIEQDEWLLRVLSHASKFKHSIVFQHIPWFLRDPSEEDEYFNINKSIRMEWLNKFYQAGVAKIMCGHYHINAGGWFNNLELVVTSAIGAQLGSDKSGFRMVKVTQESIEHKYFPFEESPIKIDEIDYDNKQ